MTNHDPKPSGSPPARDPDPNPVRDPDPTPVRDPDPDSVRDPVRDPIRDPVEPLRAPPVEPVRAGADGGRGPYLVGGAVIALVIAAGMFFYTPGVAPSERTEQASHPDRITLTPTVPIRP